MTEYSENQLDAIADALVEPGYAIIDGLLPESLINALLRHFNQLHSDAFKPAGVGRQTDFQVKETIRSDKINWIEAAAKSSAEVEFLLWMENLRLGLNSRLFMGLFDFESHFARYSVGAFYKKHLDAFRGHGQESQSNRVLSTVLYLNEDWKIENGGELVVYSEDGERMLERISPIYGRMVIFLSEKFPHEVLPAKCERNSIAGWFRINKGKL